MYQNIALFNPDHDLALANGSCHYVAPASALQFARDCALLPFWQHADALLLSDTSLLDDAFLSTCALLGKIPNVVTPQELPAISILNIAPWGWNASLVNQLEKYGVAHEVLPSNEQLVDWRRLSHRRLTIAAIRYLKTHSVCASALADVPVLCECMEEVYQRIGEWDHVMLKMPWSGSGRGLRRVDHEMTPHQIGWAQQSILKQGSVICERQYHVVQDFAMEFWVGNETVFAGYSLFQTKNGVYQQNLLLSDSEIQHHLSQWITIEMLEDCRTHLLSFIQQMFAPYYQGRLGVDMFVYQDEGEYRLNPVVEFNLRNTMGFLARDFYDEWVEGGRSGVLRMRFFPEKGRLHEEDAQLKKKYPLSIHRQRIVNGYLTLNPVGENTCYAVQVFIR